MKLKNYISLLCIFSLILVLSLSMVSAEDISEVEGISFDDTLGIDEIDEISSDIETNDELDAGNTIYISPTGSGSGSSEADPTNWNQAKAKASSGDTIQFLNGTYTNLGGTDTIISNINLVGSGNSTLDAQNAGGFFKTSGTVSISKLSFINAYTGDKQGNPDGAETGYDGECAIVNIGTLTVNDCYFASNQGIGTEGGAIHNSGICYIYNSTFFGNGGKKGGAMYSDKNSMLYIYNSVIQRCVSREGSAIHAKKATVEVHNCSVISSSAKNGLFYVKESTIKFYDSEFANSKAVDAASVINVDKESSVEVYNCLFENLTAAGSKLWFHNENGTGNGGAIVVEKEARNVLIKDSVFNNCSAKGYGGAIYIQSSTGITIDNCTFKANSAAYGNHIYSYPSAFSLSIKDSVFEIESTLETSDIKSGEIENVKVTYDVGTNNILNPTVNLLLDGSVKESGISTPTTVNLNNLASGEHNVSLTASDSTTNTYTFSHESSVFGVGVNTTKPAENSTGDKNTTEPINNQTGGNATNPVDDNTNSTIPSANQTGGNVTDPVDGDTNSTDSSGNQTGGNVTDPVDDNTNSTTPSGNQTKETQERIPTVIVVDKEFSRVATDYFADERGQFFYAKLQDINGNPLANKTVQIAINGPIYNVTTDEEGRAGLQVNLANANIYTYALSFKGDDVYDASPIASSKLTITLKKTTISAKNKSFKSSAKKVFKVTTL